MSITLASAVGAPNTIASPNGINLTSSLGSVSLEGTGTVSLTGNSLTTSKDRLML